VKPLKYNTMWSRDNNVSLAIRVSIASRERSNFRFQGNTLRIIIKKTGVKCGSQLFSLTPLNIMNHYAPGSITDTDKAYVLHRVIGMNCKWKVRSFLGIQSICIIDWYIIQLLIVFIYTVVFNYCCLPLNNSSSKLIGKQLLE